MKAQVIAITLMAVGAVTALIAAAGPIEKSPQLVAVYWASLLAIAVGAVVRRVGGRDAARLTMNDAGPNRSLDALETLALAIGSVADGERHDDMPRFHQQLGDATRPPILAFLSHRQEMLDVFGVGAFAGLMTRFATVERLLNRALSASADGAVEEAWDCLDQARTAMSACLAAEPHAERQDDSIG
ncbi:hypothetical protein Mal64_06840 [Pseudobythopirellula maris]|uniref:Uncharacterized protein n=1 Tax=Pseudobythopirellula maris TaxID=2527991 RepID=A0A5C5ZS36_9BACT|nr:hypothetical protein [Pseudobythopirellula maris]TWT90299.1 hypothetical protein Mal64_06840 [Pseudobythopirellula maris]